MGCKCMNEPNKNLKAVSNDEELAKMEESLGSEVSQVPEVDKVEQTTESGLAPTEEKAVEEKPAEDTSTEATQLNDEELSKLSDKAQKRIRDLTRKLREAEKGKKPKEEPVIDMGSVEPHTDVGNSRLPWEEPINSSLDQEERVRRVAEATARDTFNKSWREEKKAEVAQKMFDTLSKDIEYVKARYPELDENNPKFDSDLTAKVANWYKPQYDKHRQEGKYANFVAFVDDVMSLRESEADRKSQRTALRVAQQAAEQPLPQDGGESTKEVTVQDLISRAKSLKDLEQLEKQIRG